MDEVIDCASYTRARQFPKVIGSIAGTPLHTTISYAQLVAGLGSFILLVKSRGLWMGLVVSPLFRLVIVAGLPLALAWVVRYARYEGRAPRHALRGILSLWGRLLCAPDGTVDGHPYREAKPADSRAPAVFVRSSP